MELKSHRFFNGVTSASASASYLTDYRFNDIPQRTIQGVLTSGAQVNVWTYSNRESEDIPFLASSISASSFSFVIAGPVAKIKIEKVGSSGTAWVDGIV